MAAALNYIRNIDDGPLRRALSGDSLPALPILTRPYFRELSDPNPYHQPNGILWRSVELLENSSSTRKARGPLSFWAEQYTPISETAFDHLATKYTSHDVFIKDVAKVGENESEGWRLAAVLGIADNKRWERWDKMMTHAVERENYNDSDKLSVKVISLFWGCIAGILGLYQVDDIRPVPAALETALMILRAVPPLENWSESNLSPTVKKTQEALDEIIVTIVQAAHVVAWARICITLTGDKEKYKTLEGSARDWARNQVTEEWSAMVADEFLQMQEVQEKRERRAAKDAMKWQKITTPGPLREREYRTQQANDKWKTAGEVQHARKPSDG